jgi:hypothetical protein
MEQMMHIVRSCVALVALLLDVGIKSMHIMIKHRRPTRS